VGKNRRAAYRRQKKRNEQASGKRKEEEIAGRGGPTEKEASERDASEQPALKRRNSGIGWRASRGFKVGNH